MSSLPGLPSTSKVTLDALEKRAFTGGESFIAFEIDDASEEPARKKVKAKSSALPAAKDRGSTRRRAIDVDLEEGDERQGAQPWAHYVSWHLLHDATSMLNAELAAFADYMSPTAAEHQLRAEIIDSIARAIRGRWPDAQVLPFGSFATQSYLPFGDIDLVIVSGSIAKFHPRKVLFQLSALLQTRGLAQDVTVIHKARVPIIKFTSVRANVRIDISLNQEGGLKAVPIVNSLLADNGGRAARSMVAFIKAYLRSRDLNEVYNGGISSFSVICMVVSFLQLHPRVRTGQIDAVENMGLLLVEFFELYGKHYNYEVVGISTSDGGSYFGKDTRQWNKRTDRQGGLYLCIEDPGDSANDIASGAYNTYAIRQAFAAAYDGLITALHDRQYAVFRVQQDRRMPEFLEKPSLLGAIYVMSIDEIAKRKLNAQEAFAAVRRGGRVAVDLPPLQMLDADPDLPSRLHELPAKPIKASIPERTPRPVVDKAPKAKSKPTKTPEELEQLEEKRLASIAETVRANAVKNGLSPKKQEAKVKAALDKAKRKAEKKAKKEANKARYAADAPARAARKAAKQNPTPGSRQSSRLASIPAGPALSGSSSSAASDDSTDESDAPDQPARTAVAKALDVEKSAEEGEVSMDESNAEADEPSRYSLHVRQPSKEMHVQPRRTSQTNALLQAYGETSTFQAESSNDESSAGEFELDAAREKAQHTRDYWAAKGRQIIDVDD